MFLFTRSQSSIATKKLIFPLSLCLVSFSTYIVLLLLFFKLSDKLINNQEKRTYNEYYRTIQSS